MKIIVFVKQVPDTDDVKLDPKTGNLCREGVKSMLNPLDANAVEAALRLLGGERVIGDASVVFQSGGVQGGGVALELTDSVYGSVYFCYTSRPELYG